MWCVWLVRRQFDPFGFTDNGRPEPRARVLPDGGGADVAKVAAT